MDYDRLLTEVKRRAQLGSTGDAQRVIRAVVETLGERLGDHEQKDVQAQLPRQMKGWIHQRDNGEPFPIDQFYSRVERRADLDYDQAMTDTHIVLSLLAEGISEGELADIFETLPDDYRQAFS